MSVSVVDKLVLENLPGNGTQTRDARGDACSIPQLPHLYLVEPADSYYTTRQPARETKRNLAIRTRDQK